MSDPTSGKSVTQRRPNASRRWRCGFESMGMACSDGPTQDGVCCQVQANKQCGNPTTADCQTTCAGAESCQIAKMRPASLRLTNDDLGPCIPVRAPWFSRQILALNAAILVGGILLCAMAIPQRESIFVPGTLSAKHSQILGNHLVSDRCSQCHPNSHSGIDASLDQDALCLNCHVSHLPDAVLRSPHDLTSGQFTKLASYTSNAGPDAERPNQQGQLSGTRCAQCHVEHRGPVNDLQAISDQRCQSCHQTKFASFENGHPEFEGFPYRTQRRLAFDHRAHAEKHFAQKQESFDCRQCHLDPGSAEGAIIRSVGFEKACASCHSQPIRSATINGWALFQLPSIDASDALDSELGLGAWPSTARYGYDGPMTTPMRFLLAADPEIAAVLPNLPASGNLADVAIHKPDEVAALRTLAVGMQRMIAEVSEHGQVAWERRLTQVAVNTLNRELTEPEAALIDEMVAGLPPDLFRQMERDWFGSASHPVASGSKRSKPEPNVPARLVSDQEPPKDDLLEEGLGEDLLSEDLLGEDLLSEDLLDGETADALLLGNDQDADALLLGSDATLDPDLLLSPTAEEESSAAARKLTKILGSQHVSQSGWYLDADLLALRYMPKGHADPLLAAWTQFSVLLNSADSKSRKSLEALHPFDIARSRSDRQTDTNHGIPGGCTDCHLLPSSSASQEKSAWTSILKPDDLRLFTKFDHRPHLTLPMIQDCRYCHVLEADSPTPASLRSLSYTADKIDERFHRDEFKSMQRSQCNACHHQGGATSACTQCHNYHVGSEGFDWSQAR